MNDLIRNGAAALVDFILPRVCIVCGCRLNSKERHLCLHCLMEMPLTHFWSRSHNPMADRFNEVIERCIQDKIEEKEAYAHACALFFFNNDDDYRKIPYQLKYQSNTDIGSFFGNMLGARLSSSELWSDVDTVIPVPLHWSRLWKRGYNQAEIIAAAVAERLGARMSDDIIIRNRRTKTQTMMDIKEKELNVSGAFSVNRRVAETSGKDIRHILLVDDVFTTGSTLFECFRALRSVFPSPVRISVATLGFVGGV